MYCWQSTRKKSQKKEENSTRVSALLKGSQSPKERQSATSTSNPATAAQSNIAVVAVDLFRLVFGWRIDWRATKLAILDLIINFMHEKSVFLPTRNNLREGWFPSAPLPPSRSSASLPFYSVQQNGRSLDELTQLPLTNHSKTHSIISLLSIL